jgi:hypothetical protein
MLNIETYTRQKLDKFPDIATYSITMFIGRVHTVCKKRFKGVEVDSLVVVAKTKKPDKRFRFIWNLPDSDNGLERPVFEQGLEKIVTLGRTLNKLGLKNVHSKYDRSGEVVAQETYDGFSYVITSNPDQVYMTGDPAKLRKMLPELTMRNGGFGRLRELSGTLGMINSVHCECVKTINPDVFLFDQNMLHIAPRNGHPEAFPDDAIVARYAENPIEGIRVYKGVDVHASFEETLKKVF